MSVQTWTPAWHAEQTPERPAIIMAGSSETITFAALDQCSRQLAQALRARGLEPGGQIAILMENNRAFFEIAWAAQRSGVYYTPINSHLRAAEVQYILDDCGATVLISTPAMAEVLAGLDLSRVPTFITVGGQMPGAERYEDVVAGALSLPELDEVEGREMLYSSGTTGRPKGVRKALEAVPFGDPASESVQIAQGVAALGAGPGAVYLSPAPLYHAAPLVYSMSMHRAGATVVQMERFDAVDCLRLIEQHRVTHTQFVPTMFVRMLKLAEEQRARYDLSSLVFAVHAGAPCPVEIKSRMLDWWGPIIYEYYSGTEGVGNTFITPQEWREHPGSVGRPAQPCHIVGENGEELPFGQVGLVYFEGGMPFEYHNDPAKTTSTTHPSGWRTLGDIGYLDDEGYLYLTDRKAHMIISGGVNIYPQEAENVLTTHPTVRDAAVIGIPDDEMGEAVKALVQLEEPATDTSALEEELLAYCRGSLATYKCPRSIDFVSELPRDDNGKLYKRMLRERYWRGHDSLVV
jgi:long-chain acyl-CoA synthetase